MNRFLRIACTIRAGINPMDWITHPLRTFRWYRRYRAFLIVATVFGAYEIGEEPIDERAEEDLHPDDQPMRN